MYWLITAIISTALAVDNAVANAIAKDKNNEITKQASKIASEVAKDNAILDQLEYAYNTKNDQLLQSIINSSPVGSRYAQLKQEKANVTKSISKLNKDRVAVKQAEVEAMNKINEATNKAQTTGSAIVDLIQGGTTSTPVEYKSPIQQNQQKSQGGIK